jgi:hypothetical protein
MLTGPIAGLPASPFELLRYRAGAEAVKARITAGVVGSNTPACGAIVLAAAGMPQTRGERDSRMW